jgi:hypothetical protein
MYGVSAYKPAILVILGADRVGKSTMIADLKNSLLGCSVERLNQVVTLHFSGPKPHHDSPIEQYTDPLDLAINNPSPNVIICDRGFSEVCFYEKYRRGVDISEEWAWTAESYFASRASRIRVFMIKRDWEWSKPFHIQELNNEYPDCTKYFLNSKLKAREAEHHAYYKYMEDYLKNRSLLPSTIFNHNNSKEAYEYLVSV